jgi:homoserine dehydrogenase
MGILGTSGTGFFQHDGYYRRLPVVPPDEVESALFLRLDVVDRPGVLAQIAGLLADRGVSIDSVIQRAAEGRADLVILTHPAPEGRAQEAIANIAAAGVCHGTPRLLRVLSR